MDNTPLKPHLIEATTKNSSIILIRNRMKGILHKQGYNLSKDFFNGFNVEVRTLLDKSISRARQNGRKRVMIKDL